MCKTPHNPDAKGTELIWRLQPPFIFINFDGDLNCRPWTVPLLAVGKDKLLQWQQRQATAAATLTTTPMAEDLALGHGNVKFCLKIDLCSWI
jgi:hypothetical protein